MPKVVKLMEFLTNRWWRKVRVPVGDDRWDPPILFQICQGEPLPRRNVLRVSLCMLETTSRAAACRDQVLGDERADVQLQCPAVAC
jgi:hypothetical protein